MKNNTTTAKATGTPVATITSRPGERWTQGTVTGLNIRWSASQVPVTSLRFSALAFDEASEYGINDGRVSKLWLADYTGVVAYEYDRGPCRNDANLSDAQVDAIVTAILAELDFDVTA